MINDSYAGPERRHRRVFVTNNHEYHCLDDVCIAVRDVTTEAFLRKHPAMGKTVSSALRLGPGGVQSTASPAEARTGERIHLVEGVDDLQYVLTSPLKKIERPMPDVIAQYTRR
jgi:hypothetical protein